MRWNDPDLRGEALGREFFAGVELLGERVSREGLMVAVLTNVSVQTERGMEPYLDHLVRRDDWMDDPRHQILYRCVGCGELTCGCNGGTEDERCDDCVVGDRA